MSTELLDKLFTDDDVAQFKEMLKNNIGEQSADDGKELIDNQTSEKESTNEDKQPFYKNRMFMLVMAIVVIVLIYYLYRYYYSKKSEQKE